jgi:polyketide synthase-associated protein
VLGDATAPEAAVSWPLAHEDTMTFIFHLCDQLFNQGYCVINMPERDEDYKASLMEQVVTRTDWHLFTPDLEAAYWGRDNATKVSKVEYSPPAWSPGAIVDDADDALTVMDRELNELNFMMYPFTQEYLGYETYCRMNTWLRVPMTYDDERALKPNGLKPADYEDGKVLGHLNFLERRRLCLFYHLSGGPSKVHLLPGQMPVDAEIVLSESQLLVFRHDWMTYRYTPGHNAMALQCWSLDAPWMEDDHNEDGLAFVELPMHMQEEKRVKVLAANTCTAAAISNVEGYWNALFVGIDGHVPVPLARWDHKLYYQEDYEEGTTYVKHGAFVMDDRLVCFDNSFFGLDETEVSSMSPAQRLCLEIGYETLSMVGYTKDTVRNKRIATLTGDSQSDWVNVAADIAPTPTSYAGGMNSVTGSRLSFALGLRGPCQHIDTACSSSLVALDRGHKTIAKAVGDQMRPNIGVVECRQALVTGLSLLLDPHLYIGYCGARMLSRTGRCFTFDGSADGFARGEGCAALFLHSPDDVDAAERHPLSTAEELCNLVGSATNQDGRSATMTAPSGPAQREATKRSLLMSGFETTEVSACECHGTGTALGDPIEVSALKGAFAQIPREQHPDPLPHSSAKTNVGHNEANAGLLGLTKCVMMLGACASPPNNHLVSLNSHLDVHGYPALFGCAPYDFAGKSAGLMGVSSFGSGGTNARADVWGRCMRGAHKTGGLTDFSRYLRTRGVYFDRVEEFGTPGPVDSDELYINGSWDAWKGSKKMTREPETGTYEAYVTIGDTLSEQFQIILNSNPKQVIHPAYSMAGADAPVHGPDAETHINWVIDKRIDKAVDPEKMAEIAKSMSEEDIEAMEAQHGDSFLAIGREAEAWIEKIGDVGTKVVRHLEYEAAANERRFYAYCIRIKAQIQSQQVSVGATYLIKFHWAFCWERGETKRISWELVPRTNEVDGQRKLVVKRDAYKHKYFVASTWSSWQLSEMLDVGDSFYKASAKVGPTGQEEFRIVRDRDWGQVIYPAKAHCIKTSVPIRGPDSNDKGRNWLIKGPPGSKLEVLLRVNAGFIELQQTVEGKGSKRWNSSESEHWHDYYISGTWNQWGMSLMTRDKAAGSCIYRHRFAMGRTSYAEQFRIVLDKDWSQMLYPAHGEDGQWIMMGPDANAGNASWIIEGHTFMEFEIVLDATPGRMTIDWHPV